MIYVLGSTSRSNLKLVDPRLVRIVEKAILITKQDFTVFAGARTAAEQNKLFQIGRTTQKNRKPVTSKDGFRRKSSHQITASGFGNAVDLVPWSNGKAVWDWDLIFPIAAAISTIAKARNVRVRWGGNWNQSMNDYGSSVSDIKEAVERYKRENPGPDFIDGPHYELA